VRALPVALLLALIPLATLACGGAEEDGAGRENGPEGDRTVVETGPDTATLVAFEAAGVPSYTPMRERGIGIVHFDPGPRLAGRAADTIRVTGSAEGGGVVARLIVDSMAVYRFEAAPGVLDAPGALEFGYEEVGLPLLEDPGAGRWRVHLGTRDGEPVSGWVAMQPGRTRTLWEELLPTMPLFFVVPPDSIRFHASQDGPAVPFTLAPRTSGDPGDPGDYILWPIETTGDWMRVRAVTPSDYCFDPPAPREDTLWIRWREGSGNPRVWFFTRGC
jgi:hypothetical protein